MVVIDATMLMLWLQPNASPARDADGKPLEQGAERVSHLISDLEGRGVTVVIPTPALAEVLVRLRPENAEKVVDRIGRQWTLKLAPFDVRAAVEVAAMTRDPRDGGIKPGDEHATRAKLKYDRQIVAIAKVNQATAIYSDDGDIRAIAERSGIKVVGLSELPLPPKAPTRHEPENDSLPLLLPDGGSL